MMNKMISILFLIVVIVNCESLPRFEIGNKHLTNNSYIHYGSISDGDSALKCVTNSTNCCTDVGNWSDERGRAVQQGADEATCLYATRGHGVVSLNRISDCIPDTSGLWRCEIPDSSGVMQTIYIYISNDTRSGAINNQLTSMTFTLHTEPSVSPPEFSIICHTQGGPATTVIWEIYYDPFFKVITDDSDHEKSQIIVDTSRNSVYENRLRVRGREGGTYICTVSNSIQSHFSNPNGMRITISVAREPTNLAAIHQSNSTQFIVAVTWKSPERRTIGYVIYYQPKGGAVSSDNVTGRETETHLLGGLQRGVTYNISIVALSQHLPSPLVGPVTVVSSILEVA